MPKVSTANETMEMEPPLPETRLGRLLSLAQKHASRSLRAELEPFGITPVQFAVLIELYCRDGLSLNSLSERLRADPPTISGVVDCLVSAGYVERRPDPNDRRRLRLFATEKARAIEDELYAADARREAAMTRRLAPEEREALKELLRRVVGL
ncbi:MAG: MarR family transcriptional regulator [Armatimonadetes bacterium]|nr:MarR family transcriptional regulator [Armatimonadota bacterium]